MERLDKFLSVTKTASRSEAGKAAKQGKICVNGKVVKASYDVKVGDIIEVSFGQRKLKIRVLDVREFTAKSDASSLYEVIE